MVQQAADEHAAFRPWPPRRRVIAAVGWSSFLGASLGTMLVFAVIDPQIIIDAVHAGGPHIDAWWLTRTGIYTLGFFLLWFVAAVASALTAMLTTTPPATPPARPPPRPPPRQEQP